MSLFSPTVEQKAAIDFSGACVITACPGSGKTAVVSMKVRNVLPLLPQYKGVIAISFTNKASDELKARCLIGGTDIKRSYFGTIDSFCISEIVLPFLPLLSPMIFPEAHIVRASSLAGDDVNCHCPDNVDDRQILAGALKLLEGGKVVLESVAKIASVIIETSEAARKYILARYTHLFIDEYQDSGGVQHSLFLSLHRLGLTCVAVGDVSQSIFAFSGGDPRFLKMLCKMGAEFQVFSLTQNHRSAPSIINYANRLLDENAVLIPSDENRVYRKTIKGNANEIAAWIDSVIAKLVDRFDIKRMSDVGILCRNKTTAESIYENLSSKSYLLKTSTFDNRSEVEAALFSRILRMRFSPDSSIQSLWNELNFKGDRLTKIKLKMLLKKCKTSTIMELFDFIMAASEIILGRSPDRVVVSELESILDDLDAQKAFMPMEDGAIQIMTLHKSKGLEFDLVFHLDLHEWIFPAKRIENGQPYFASWEQDINLHYVGITRARKACILVTSTSRTNSSGQVKNGSPTEFFELDGLDGLYKQLKVG